MAFYEQEVPVRKPMFDANERGGNRPHLAEMHKAAEAARAQKTGNQPPPVEQNAAK